MIYSNFGNLNYFNNSDAVYHSYSLLLEALEQIRLQRIDNEDIIRTYSTNIYEYHDLQKGLIFIDFDLIRQSLEKEALQDDLPNTIPSEYLAYLSWNRLPSDIQISFYIKCFKYNSFFINLFQISTYEVQEEILKKALDVENKQVFSVLYNALPVDKQIAFYNAHFENREFFITLFQSLNYEIQEEILKNAIQGQNEEVSSLLYNVLPVDKQIAFYNAHFEGQELFITLFQSLNCQVQEEILKNAIHMQTQEEFSLLYNTLPVNQKVEFYVGYFQNIPLFIALFENFDNEAQEQILDLFFRYETEENCCRLFDVLLPKMQQEHPSFIGSWFRRAISEAKKGIVMFFLQRGVSVREIDSRGYTILDQAIIYEKYLGSRLIDEIRRRDAGFTEELFIIKMFYLLFPNLSSNFPGLFPFQIPQLHTFIFHAIQEMENISTMNPIADPQIKEAIEHALEDSRVLAERAIQQSSVVYCGWQGHGITCIFTKELYVYIDTGADKEPGLHFFKIRERIRKNDIESVIFELQRNRDNAVSKEEGEQFCKKMIPYMLCDPKEMEYVPYQQTGPTCTLFSIQGALLALSILRLIENNGIGELSTETLSKMASFGQVGIDHFFDELSRQMLERGLSLLDKYPQFFNKEAMSIKILESCIETDRFESICAIIRKFPDLRDYQDPISRDSLLQMVFDRKLGCVLDFQFAQLLEMGCNQECLNSYAQNLIEFMENYPVYLEEYEQWLLTYQDSPGVLEGVVTTLRRCGLIDVLLNYEGPITNRSLVTMALEEKRYHFFAFLLSLGYESLSDVDQGIILGYSEEELEKLGRYLAYYNVSLDDERFAFLTERGEKLEDSV